MLWYEAAPYIYFWGAPLELNDWVRFRNTNVVAVTLPLGWNVASSLKTSSAAMPVSFLLKLTKLIALEG